MGEKAFICKPIKQKEQCCSHRSFLLALLFNFKNRTQNTCQTFGAFYYNNLHNHTLLATHWILESIPVYPLVQVFVLGF